MKKQILRSRLRRLKLKLGKELPLQVVFSEFDKYYQEVLEFKDSEIINLRESKDIEIRTLHKQIELKNKLGGMIFPWS